MWEYWRDKKGVIEAIKQQYPHLLETDMRIMLLVTQAETFLQMLDTLMQRIDGEGKETPE